MKIKLQKREILNSLKEIHQSSITPFILFNKKKIIIFINNAFIKKFHFLNESKVIGEEIDFLYSKEEKELLPFSDLSIDNILNGNQIYSFFPKGKEETFYYISTFQVGEDKGDTYYYSILKEITDLEEKLMEESIRALVTASQFKDYDTGNHIKRINTYSYIIAKELYKSKGDLYPEIDNEFIERIFKVASMHDIGKIGTPDYILTKPGKLTDDEFKIIKEHTLNGAFILSKMAGQMARDIALFHHEKWDGTGYPYQFKEEQIPVEARIVALADVYDALRMERIYKSSFSHEKTIDIIKKGKGKHFDPNVVDCFLNVEEQFKNIFTKMRDDEKSRSFYADIDINLDEIKK